MTTKPNWLSHDEIKLAAAEALTVLAVIGARTYINNFVGNGPTYINELDTPRINADTIVADTITANTLIAPITLPEPLTVETLNATTINSSSVIDGNIIGANSMSAFTIESNSLAGYVETRTPLLKADRIGEYSNTSELVIEKVGGSLVLKGDILQCPQYTVGPAATNWEMSPGAVDRSIIMSASGSGNVVCRDLTCQEQTDKSAASVPPIIRKLGATGVQTSGPGFQVYGGSWTKLFPAGYFDTDGVGLRFIIIGNSANNATAKQIGISLNGSTNLFLMNINTSTSSYFVVEGCLIRDSSTSMLVIRHLRHDTQSIGQSRESIPGGTYAASISFPVITSTGVAVGDITLRAFYLWRL